jgi:ABC-type sugar transport system ATPase subunit
MLKPSRVVLLDEPLAGLDGPLRWHVRRAIRNWQQTTNATVVYVTHDQEEALAVGDRVAVLQGGQIQQVSAPAELYRRPATEFVATFVGQPPMNLIAGERTGVGSWRSGVWGLELTPPNSTAGNRILAGIRPERIQFGPAPDTAWAAVAGRVTDWEYRGETTLVRLEAGEKAAATPSPAGESLWVKALFTTSLPPRGERTLARFRLCDVYWFDGKTGRALGAPGET